MPIARLLAVLFLFGSLLNPSQSLAGERLVQSMTEARTYVHFSVDKDAVQKLLPAGWVSNPGTGAFQDANMFIALIEGIASHNAEGKPVPHHGKSAVLVVPVKNEKTGAAAAMVVGGFVSDPQAVPGAYDVYVPAQITMEKSGRSDGGVTVIEERWAVSTPAGDKLAFSAVYPRGVGTRAHIEPRIYAAVRPEFYRIYKADQVTEVVHSTADATRRAKAVEASGSGPQLARLFDGKERLVAVMSLPAYFREIYLPE